MSKYEGWRPVRFDDVVPGMKKNNWAILIWTLIYLLDLVLIIVIQGVSYNLPQNEIEDLFTLVHYNSEDPVQTELFPGCEVMDGYPGYPGFYFLMRDSEGVLKVMAFQENQVLNRFKVAEEVTVPEAEDVAVNIETPRVKATLRILHGTRFDWDGCEEKRTTLDIILPDGSSKQMGVYMFIAVMMLLVEYGIYCQIQKLRE